MPQMSSKKPSQIADSALTTETSNTKKCSLNVSNNRQW